MIIIVAINDYSLKVNSYNIVLGEYVKIIERLLFICGILGYRTVLQGGFFMR